MKKERSIINKLITSFTLLSTSLITIVIMIASSTLYLLFNNLESLVTTATFERTQQQVLLLQKYSDLDQLKKNTAQAIKTITIFKKSRDDRFGKIIYTTEEQFKKISNKSNTYVGINTYLEKAYTATIIDRKIRKIDSGHYSVAYFPFDSGEQRYIIRALFPVSDAIAVKARSATHFLIAVKTLFIVSTCSFIILLISGFIFSHKFKSLLKKITHIVHIALAEREAIHIHEPHSEFSEIAESFNILLEEIRNHEDTIEKLKLQSNFDEIFKHGVELLKQKNLVNAEHIFRTLTILKPSSFGSYFNLGVICARQNSYHESLEMFHQALIINPNDTLSKEYSKKISAYIEPSLDNEKCS